MNTIIFLATSLLLCVGLLGCTTNEPVDVIDAAAAGNASRLEELLGPSPSLAQTRNGYGESPLIAAVESNQLKCAEILLNHKADVNWQNGVGDSPILCAIRTEDPAMISLLLEYNPDFELSNDSGVSAKSYVEDEANAVDESIRELVYAHQSAKKL